MLIVRASAQSTMMNHLYKNRPHELRQMNRLQLFKGLSTIPHVYSRSLIMNETLTTEMAKFLVNQAPRILPRTPCSLQLVAAEAAHNGTTITSKEALEVLKELGRTLVNSVVLEREGSMGHFLIFYYVEPLAAFAGIDTVELQAPEPTTSDLLTSDTSLESLFTNIRRMTTLPTARERLRIDKILERCPELPLTELCSSESRSKCLADGNTSCLNKIHFERVVHAHTDASLGDCSYLDTCFKWRQCKFVHYKVVYPDHFMPRTKLSLPESVEPQYINADLLQLDLKALGNDYSAIIIDPPWAIHTNPSNNNACTDEKILALDVGALQESGIVFLWVTGRVLDLGRQCLAQWGYTHVEEVIWLKTNQLGRTICTGRTGHWLNHTKEHVLVGTKGTAVVNLPRLMYTDVLVSSALGRSQKPSELYSIIERLVDPRSKKIELFGRKTNIRPGWLTIGNEMGSTHIYDPWLKKQLKL